MPETISSSPASNFIGERRKRVEDVPMLVGAGQYTSDLRFSDMAELAIVRSPHPHARIVRVDTSAALKVPGVIAAFAARDLPEILKPFPGAPRSPEARFVTPTALAAEVVRYVGEAVAVVVAEDVYAARDGADAVVVEYAPLPPVIGVVQDATTPVLHAGWPSNLAQTVQIMTGAGADGLDGADVIIEETLTIGRLSAQPMEPRAAVAVYDQATRQLTVYFATQSVNMAQRSLCALLDLPADRVRVIVPNIGGAFGVKTRLYGEETIAACLAMRLGRPMRWVGDRHEEFTVTNQARAQVHHIRMGLDRAGHILAFVDHFQQDAGAYNITADGPVYNTAVSVHGPYHIPHLAMTGDIILTNSTPTGPYRGAGRPEAAYVMERMLDRAADRLGLDRAEIRQRNLIRPDEMPYDSGIRRQQIPIIFDTGDYPAGFAQVLGAIGYAEFRARQAAARARGVYLGIGVVNSLEMSGIGVSDSAILRVDPAGAVWVMAAVSQMGQGHPTTYAQIAAERLGVPFERIHVIEGDSATGTQGPGTFASRATVAAGTAIARAALQLRQRILAEAARQLDAPIDALDWRGEYITVRAAPVRRVAYGDVAASLGPAGIAVEASGDGNISFGYQGHGVIVAVDPDLLTVAIEQYVIVHDAGNIINPLIVDGQTIGAAVQGLGNVLFEEMRYDSAGLPQATALHRYVLPASIDTPEYTLIEQHFPARANAEGFRGVGEGGTITSLPAIAQAVEDALAPFGVRLNALPLTPQRLFEAVRAAQSQRESAGGMA